MNTTDKSSKDAVPQLKGVTAQMKATLSLLALSYILAVMSLAWKEYVALVCCGIAILAMCFLPVSRYLRKEPGRLAFAYISFLSISYLVILPSAGFGFRFGFYSYDGIAGLGLAFLVIPVSILLISFAIYRKNLSNINSILKSILRGFFDKRETQLKALGRIGKRSNITNEQNSCVIRYKIKVYAWTNIILATFFFVLYIIGHILSPNDNMQLIFFYVLSLVTIDILILNSFLPNIRSLERNFYFQNSLVLCVSSVFLISLFIFPEPEKNATYIFILLIGELVILRFFSKFGVIKLENKILSWIGRSKSTIGLDDSTEGWLK